MFYLFHTAVFYPAERSDSNVNLRLSVVNYYHFSFGNFVPYFEEESDADGIIFVLRKFKNKSPDAVGAFVKKLKLKINLINFNPV